MNNMNMNFTNKKVITSPVTVAFVNLFGIVSLKLGCNFTSLFDTVPRISLDFVSSRKNSINQC
jgi:hypothetical protein